MQWGYNNFETTVSDKRPLTGSDEKGCNMRQIQIQMTKQLANLWYDTEDGTKWLICWYLPIFEIEIGIILVKMSKLKAGK